MSDSPVPSYPVGLAGILTIMSCPGQLEAPCEKDGGDDNTIAEEIITDKAGLHTQYHTTTR